MHCEFKEKQKKVCNLEKIEKDFFNGENCNPLVIFFTLGHNHMVYVQLVLRSCLQS
jgi:hypothetical protein